MARQFLDPINDVAFKKIFGDKQRKDILLSFLNAVLERSEGQRIIDVLTIDPHNQPAYFEARYSIVDIKCVDECKRTYIIEMQVLEHDNYLDRCQYYVAAEIARQLAAGGDYKELTPVIFIGIA